MRTYTVTNQKGGVAKTTTAATLAHICALNGYRTLLVDFDAQGHASAALGLDSAQDVFDVFAASKSPAQAICLTGRDNLHILRGNTKTRGAEAMFQAMRTQLSELSAIYSRVAAGYDRVVIDTPAGGMFQELAVHVADVVAIPARMEQLSVDGVLATLALLGAIPSAGKRDYTILPTSFDIRLNEHRANLDILCGSVGRVATPIPERVCVPVANAQGLTVFEARGCNDVAEAYMELAREMEAA